jgi:hypothetical protein
LILETSGPAIWFPPVPCFTVILPERSEAVNTKNRISSEASHSGCLRNCTEDALLRTEADEKLTEAVVLDTEDSSRAAKVQSRLEF